MDDESERFRKITMKVLTMQLNSVSVMDIVAYGGAAIGMIVTVKEYLAGNVSLAGAFTIILLASEFFIPLRLLGSFFHIAMNGMSASDKIFKILDMEEPKRGEHEIEGEQMDVTLQHVGIFLWSRKRKGITGYFADHTIRKICLSGGSVRLWKKYHCGTFDREESYIFGTDPDQ